MDFEGEYINGIKWKGKGKKYDNFGQLEYEGEYKFGTKHGKGKEYYGNGRLKFEGEYLNDQEYIGIGYDVDGNILYN